MPIILSHSLWQNRFGSDPKIIGQSLTLDGQTFSVIGVMPASFQFPVERTPVEFWTTIALDAQPVNNSPPITAQRGAGYLDVIARLKPQVTMATAQTEMARIQEGLNRQYPENRPKGISLVPEADAVVGDMRQGLFILLGAVGLVLLIACANLSNLLLARATTRTKEISVRTALGATRWMIVRQLLAESLLLAATGAAAGLALAAWGIKLLTALAPGDLPRITESGINLQVLVFTAVVAVFTSILFGLVPALQAAKPELAATLKEGGRSGTETAGARPASICIGRQHGKFAVRRRPQGSCDLRMRSHRAACGRDPGELHPSTPRRPCGSDGRAALRMTGQINPHRRARGARFRTPLRPPRPLW